MQPKAIRRSAEPTNLYEFCEITATTIMMGAVSAVIIFMLLVSASPALAQQYLPQPDMAACLARSAAMCSAMSCQKGTDYWWSCQPLTDGTAAVVIDTTRPEFAAVHPRGPGLTTPEQSALIARAVMSTKLPDILSSAVFLARFTSAQKTAITNFASTHPAVQAAWTRLQSGDVDLQDSRVATFLQTIRTAAIINDADVTAATTPQSTP